MTLAAAALAVPAMFAQGYVAMGTSPESMTTQVPVNIIDNNDLMVDCTATVEPGAYFTFYLNMGSDIPCGPTSNVDFSTLPETGSFQMGSSGYWHYTGTSAATIKMTFDVMNDNPNTYTFEAGNSGDVKDPVVVTFNIGGVDNGYQFLSQPTGLTSDSYVVTVGNLGSTIYFQVADDYTTDYEIASISCNSNLVSSDETYQVENLNTYWQVMVSNNETMNNAEFTVTLAAIEQEVATTVYLGIDDDGEWPSEKNTDYALTDEGDGIYTGTFEFTEGQGVNIWWPSNVSVDGAVSQYMPLGPNTEEKENLNPYGGEFGVDMTTDGYWYVTEDVELTVTLDLNNHNVTFSAPIVERTVTFNFTSLDELENPFYSYVTVTDLNSDDVVNIDSNSYQYTFKGEAMLTFVADDSYTITLSVDDLANEDLEEYGIGEIITVDEQWAEYLNLPIGSYLLILNNSEYVDGLEFNIEVIYIAPEPENSPINVTLNFAGEVENDAYTYVEFEGEALYGGSIATQKINKDVWVFSCVPPVALSFTPVEGYRIVSIYGPENSQNMEIVSPPLSKENGTWGVNLFPGEDVYINITVAEGETSGVGSLGADSLNAPVYNLQGVKVANDVNNLPAGLYIVNGKKVLVK